ncbi:DNA replication terminus site-binding protein [Pseudoalteromonas sp. NBT06-2]|uniref:DNA replication terminus site-binding protein n=1 Tax=Pseudoalteromonas sp. NBT06-2 TaxID=2025950 RepID=UPI000BA5A42C|nr:DNA replication terminus site-binding protein [Pseudoalteromonas sp. NBT06-2]PAJ73887.1 DNA replication terminus site-binding protein [Pseudoalteromonas sp. NBT06-2]
MNAKFDIRSQFDNINVIIDQLILELKSEELIYSSYYHLPDISSSDETKSTDQILVTETSFNDAFSKCCDSFKDYFKKSELSGRVIKRHPGIIAIKSSTPDLLITRIKQINDAKNKFKNTIISLGNNDSRFEIVHNAIPNLITLCAYRNIHFENLSPYSIRFSWMNKHSIKLLSKFDALKMLDNSQIFGCSNKIDSQSWQELIHKEKLNVLSLKDNDKLRIRRPTRVSPQVNIRYDAKNRYHVSAALPFILINPNDDVKYGVLKNYAKPNKHPRKKENHYLIDRLYLEKK